MKIYLVRHAQAMWQLDAGESLDSSLTTLGHEQAKRLGEWLSCQQKQDEEGAVRIASLCASPLKRALETANYAAAGLRMPLLIRPELREAEFHVADHLPRRETPLQEFPPYECSEIYKAFQSQAQAALEWLVEQAGSVPGAVLAITHGGLIKTMLRLMLDSDSVCFQLYNTGINLVEWKRGRWHLVHLNRWDHLPPELRTV
jgi:broad specificity phosphatase PhoE